MEYVFFESNDYLVYYDEDSERWYVKNKTNMTSYDLSHKDNMSSFLRVFIEDPAIVLQEAPKKVIDSGVFNKLLPPKK